MIRGLASPFPVALLVAFLVAMWLAATLACGGAGGPPRGPDYTPEATPEAASECPDEWSAAKEAREALLGDDSAAARAKTAKVVLAQADCERIVLGGGRFAPGEHAALLEQVASLTSEQRDTVNLYNEVASYGVPLLRVAAVVGRGQLNAAFAARLKAMPTPTDMSDVGEQSAFRGEVAALVEHFETEADRELRDGIGLAQTVAGAESYQQLSCQELASLERQVPDACSAGR